MVEKGSGPEGSGVSVHKSLKVAGRLSKQLSLLSRVARNSEKLGGYMFKLKKGREPKVSKENISICSIWMIIWNALHADGMEVGSVRKGCMGTEKKLGQTSGLF